MTGRRGGGQARTALEGAAGHESLEMIAACVNCAEMQGDKAETEKRRTPTSSSRQGLCGSVT